jgi:hypothetical protein
MRGLKFVGLLLVNLAVAVIGTATLESALWRVISSHSVAAIVWKEFIFSIVCAAFIEFGMWRTLRNSAAKLDVDIGLLISSGSAGSRAPQSRGPPSLPRRVFLRCS